MPIASSPDNGHTEKNLSVSSVHPASLQVFLSIDEIPEPSLFHTELHQLFKPPVEWSSCLWTTFMVLCWFSHLCPCLCDQNWNCKQGLTSSVVLTYVSHWWKGIHLLGMCCTLDVSSFTSRRWLISVWDTEQRGGLKGQKSS